ncbi:MAG: nuclear transport factor 2 family protein [Trueperaceae bacterium]
MKVSHGKLLIGRFITIMVLVFGAAALAQSTADLEEHIRNLELERQRLMVEGDVAAVDPFHADDFRLINPFGGQLTKNDILDVVNVGGLVFLKIDISNMEVRVFGTGAALKYLATMQVELEGEVLPEQHIWHLVTYELRGDQWQAVWSVASEVREMP